MKTKCKSPKVFRHMVLTAAAAAGGCTFGLIMLFIISLLQLQEHTFPPWPVFKALTPPCSAIAGALTYWLYLFSDALAHAWD